MNQDYNRHASLIQSLAHRAIDLATDAPPHRPPPGEQRYALAAMLPSARVLLGLSAGADWPSPPTDRPVRFADGRGQCRWSYRVLAAHLHHRATGHCPPLNIPEPGGVAAELWRVWHRLATGEPADHAVEPIGHRGPADPDPSGGGCLEPRSPDEPPDHWTYRELVGLHGLQAIIDLVEACGDPAAPPDWRQRVREITAYHQRHTQPDYTTYQPWGLAAFVSNPETTWFAEQQLHDVETHLAVEGGGGAVVAALLLADAYASLTAAAAR